MSECSFEKLLQLVEKKLGTDAQLRLFDHLDNCEICRESVFHIARDRDEAFEILLRQASHGSAPERPRLRRPRTAIPEFSRIYRSTSRQPATGTLG